MKKVTTIAMSGRNHLRLKINAAKAGCGMGDLVVRMMDQLFPLSTPEHLTLIEAAVRQDGEQ